MAPACAVGPATVPRAAHSEFGKPHIRSSAKIKGPFDLTPSGLRFTTPGVRNVSTTHPLVGCKFFRYGIDHCDDTLRAPFLRKLVSLGPLVRPCSSCFPQSDFTTGRLSWCLQAVPDFVSRFDFRRYAFADLFLSLSN